MKIELNIPTDLSEITLGQYQKFLKVVDDNDESEFVHHKMVEIFCGVSLKHISKIKHKDLSFIINKISALFDGKHELVQKFTIDKIEFGFIPNLDDITSGEYMDIDTYITDWANMHKAMAVLFRPVVNKAGSKYNITDYNGTAEYGELMKRMPLSAVMGSMVFFYHLGNELLKSILTYLENNQEAMSTLNKLNLGKDGDGIHLSMLSLKEMLEDLMQFPSFPFLHA
ncbi:hypothetical protein UFOVP324_9 [uncultured Caudovirales phage]|uniref:Uncharacterized protein n=1 Tax=uncultured Caudovirales phage TaxID=2100421 RepID=A0A6J5LVG8_9CAUD|nr:hypothetical protein UFOVP324_9 [uncultured Caudovirales phage]